MAFNARPLIPVAAASRKHFESNLALLSRRKKGFKREGGFNGADRKDGDGPRMRMVGDRPLLETKGPLAAGEDEAGFL